MIDKNFHKKFEDSFNNWDFEPSEESWKNTLDMLKKAKPSPKKWYSNSHRPKPK